MNLNNSNLYIKNRNQQFFNNLFIIQAKDSSHMDILKNFTSQQITSDRTQKIADQAYQELHKSRVEVLKVVLPAIGIFILSSFKYRTPKQVAGYSALFFASGMLSNEYYQWNRLSGRLYIAMRSEFQK